MLTLSSPISSTRMSLQPLTAPTTKLVDKVKNKAQAVKRRNLVIEPQWTARSQIISINLIWKSELKSSLTRINIFFSKKTTVFLLRGCLDSILIIEFQITKSNSWSPQVTSKTSASLLLRNCTNLN